MIIDTSYTPIDPTSSPISNKLSPNSLSLWTLDFGRNALDLFSLQFVYEPVHIQLSGLIEMIQVKQSETTSKW